MYRFDVTVNNMGSRDEDVAYAVYLRSGDGVAFQQTDSAYTDASRNVTDSRIVPRGRSAVITLYGEVNEESTGQRRRGVCVRTAGDDGVSAAASVT